MNKEDAIIKKCLDDVINSLPGPDTQPDWDALISRIEEDKRRRNTHRTNFFIKSKKYLIAASVFLVIVISISLAVSPTSAKDTLVGNIIFKARQNIGSIFKISTDHRIESGDIGEEENDDLVKEFNTSDIEEAETVSDGIITFPAYIPAAYSLENITLYKVRNEVKNIFLEFADDKGNYIKLRETIIDEGNTYQINYKQDSASVSEFQEDGINYILLSLETGLSKLIWDKYGINYMLTGPLNRDEMLDIAKSIK